MKKSELTQLTQIIEHIVAKEVRKQLPTIIAETFQNMMGKSVVTEQHIEPVVEERQKELRASLKELFDGPPITKLDPVEQPRPMRTFTKNPVLNSILNETVSDLGNRERMVSSAAYAGGYSPTLSMVPGFNPNVALMENTSEEPSFLKNVPSMINTGTPPVLMEGQESSHTPLSNLPANISALDVSQHVPAAVGKALTRNYSHMMKLIDKKRGKI